MTPDRTDALRRQRALVAEHLAWLDAELAASEPGTSVVSPPPNPPTVAPAKPAPPISTPLAITAPPSSAPAEEKTDATEIEADDKLAAANARANAILEQYAATDRFNPDATRRGCILSAIAALLFGVAAVMAIYLVRYR